MGTFASSHHNAGHALENRESLGLLLKVLNEHTPGVLEDLNRVAHFAIATAEAMGLAQSEVERIELAARLHDVGKLAIPDAILNKAAPLDGHEWAIMRTHAEIGQRIL